LRQVHAFGFGASRYPDYSSKRAYMPVLVQIVGLVTAVLVPVSVAASESQVAVDANLVTALDTSASVGRYEEWLEREGVARAVVHPGFLEVIGSGHYRRIGFTVFTWSSHGHTKTLVPWTTIATSEDATRVSQHLLSINLSEESQLLDRNLPTDHYEAPKNPHQTDIALAIRSASALLKSAPSRSLRSVINIVGNGPSNSGMEPAKARDAALEVGQIVNGLVIGYGLAADISHYRTNVVGGPGSFVMQVANPQAMTEAFLAKFQLDLAGPSGGTAPDERFLTASATDDPDP
jgi:Ca-activated chloride channel family protein